ncbi:MULTISPECIES: universal stress protein [Burkholderia]|uniref:universal stress protein n=1 Tax=Burkholderia TaxID=32008 RepID=UPI001575056C|nr:MULTISPECIES: universal stress protein [Burkholderia]NTZ11020.1 universal stress protein [Burkholderia metallica]
MKYLVGFSPDQGGHEALNLAAVLARSTGGSLVVCTVVPAAWDYPSVARVDIEYANFLAQHAEKALATARAIAPGDIEADFVARSAASAAEGLMNTANDVCADCIVLGSARSATAGTFIEGRVTSNVLHNAGVPVALAPRGYSAAPDRVVKRVTCALSGTRYSASLAERAGAVADVGGVGLRIATFIVRDNQMYPTGVGYDAENMVANEFRSQAQALHDSIRSTWKGNVELTSALGDGPTWRTALESLDWCEEELIIVGSSHLGPLMRVFIGSNSGKIIRHAPVPRLVLPRMDE